MLLVSPARAPSGHRRYTDGDLDWITMVTRLRSTGMPIRTVRAYADLCREGPGNEEARLRLLREHRERVLDEMARAADHLAAIDHKIGLYEGLLGPDAHGV